MSGHDRSCSKALRVVVLRFLLAGSFLTGMSAVAVHGQNLWDHNGSTMRLEANGANRSFYYVEPRSGLPARSGDLLFEGRKSGNTYSGTAVIFSVKCGPASFPVSGDVSGDQLTITLHGKAPQRDASCRTVGQRDDTLVFTHQSVGSAAASSARPAEPAEEIFAGIVMNEPGLYVLKGRKGAATGQWYHARKAADPIQGLDDARSKFKGTYRRDAGSLVLIDGGGREIRLDRAPGREPQLIMFGSGQNFIYRWAQAPAVVRRNDVPKYAICFEQAGNEGCYDGVIFVACKSEQGCLTAFKSLGLKATKVDSSSTALFSDCRNDRRITFHVDTPVGQELAYATRLRDHPEVIEACRFAQTAGGTDPTEIELTLQQLYGSDKANSWALRDRLEQFFRQRFGPAVLQITTTVPSAAKIVIGANSSSFCRQSPGRWEHYVLQINIGKRHENLEQYNVVLAIADAYFGVAPRGQDAPLLERLDRLNYENNKNDAQAMDNCRDYIASMLGAHFFAATVGHVGVVAQ